MHALHARRALHVRQRGGCYVDMVLYVYGHEGCVPQAIPTSCSWSSACTAITPTGAGSGDAMSAVAYVRLCHRHVNRKAIYRALLYVTCCEVRYLDFALGRVYCHELHRWCCGNFAQCTLRFCEVRCRNFALGRVYCHELHRWCCGILLSALCAPFCVGTVLVCVSGFCVFAGASDAGRPRGP